MIPRRDFIAGALGAAALGRLPHELLAARAPAPERRPNLLFILADDLGYGDVSAYGRPDYRTPSIDRLIAEGVRFTNAYTAASTCTPTRAAFMTGRYQQRLGPALQRPLATIGDTRDSDARTGLAPEHPTVASLLKQAGYHTALVGKWHLGFLPEFGPNRHGFEEFFGIHSGGVDYFTHTTGGGAADLWENEAPVERSGYMTDLLTERAVQYIGRRRDRPFFLSLHYTAPHWPWEGPADAHGAPEPHGRLENGGSQPVFAAMMRSLDDGVGRVVRALARAGLDRDTLVIFTSDNGGERYSYNWPWSEGKFTLNEGGIRVPFAMRWTGRLPRGRSCGQLAISMDWTATLLAAAGAAPDPGYPLDGIDLLPFARGERPVTDRTLFWRQPYPGPAPHAAARQGKWKYLRTGDREYLYDISLDPGEKADLKERFPDAFERLRAAWRDWSSHMATVPKPAG